MERPKFNELNKERGFTELRKEGVWLGGILVVEKSMLIKNVFGIFKGLLAGWVNNVLMVILHDGLHEF